MKELSKRKKIKINKETRSEYNFKEVALTKMAKRQLLITLLSILGVTVISLGSAYAVFTSISKSADYNVIKVGTLNIDFGEDSNNTINLSRQYPMTDEEGLKLTPYIFTITNTGTLPADYEVFIEDDADMISQDNCGNNQLNKDYIKYKLDTGSPTVLSSIAGSNYKIATGSLNAGASATYTLYVWIKEGVGNDVLNKHYHGKIVVNGVNEQGILADEALLSNIPESNQYDDGTDTFITGEDPNNYIWYSGKLWRAVSVNNEAKTTKLVTQWNISAIPYNPSNQTAFEGSYMEEWLNDTSEDGFLGNLREPENFIVMDAKWNATETTSSSKPSETTIVEDTVGLLNMYEYQTSYRGTTYRNGYLNNGLAWWTLTPNITSLVRYVNHYGNADSYSPWYAYGVRPSVNLKSDVKIVSVDGTIDNPYKLKGDNDTNLTGTLLNTRFSGEYIRFGTGENNLYMIVSHESEELTKITSAEPLTDSETFKESAFGSNTTFSSTNTIGTFLNGDYLTNYVGDTYSNMIEDSTTWYLGTVGSGVSYKLAKYIDSTSNTLTSSTATAKVGLLRLGELGAGQYERYAVKVGTASTGLTTTYWTLTPYNTSNVRHVDDYGSAGFISPSSAYGVRPSLNLKSNVVITSGDGTKENPFEIQLGS